MAKLTALIDAFARPHKSPLATGAVVGGLALIAGLAYRAVSARSDGTEAGETGAGASRTADLNDDDVKTVLRAMIAASVSDGIVDRTERRRLEEAIAVADLGIDERRWLDEQITDPPRIDEIAGRVNTPELAAQVYTAARLTIAPDTLQERQFLKDLAEALDVPTKAVEQIEAELSS